MPLRFNAASSPMLDMVVATTVSLARRPRGLQVAGRQQQDSVAVDDVAVLVREESAVGVAIEGDAHRGMANLDLRGDDLRVERTAVLVDVAAVGAGVGDDDFASEVREELRSNAGGGSVGAVDDDALAVEREARDGGEEEADVVGAVGFVHVRRRGLLRWRGRGSELAEDLVLNRELSRVGQLVAVGAEDLDAVILPGIVRGGDDDTCRKTVRVREESNSRSSDDTSVLDRGAPGSEAGGERSGDPTSGFAGVHAEEDTRGGTEMMGKGEADGVDGRFVERGLTGDSADAVGSKELLHELRVSVTFVAVTWASRLPLPRRAVMD